MDQVPYCFASKLTAFMQLQTHLCTLHMLARSSPVENIPRMIMSAD